MVCSRGGGTLDRFGDVYYLTNYYTSFPYIPDLPGAWTARAHAFALIPAAGGCLLVTDAPNDGRTMLEPGMVIRLDRIIRKEHCLGDFEETVVVTEDSCEKITDAKRRWW